jgi:integrase
MPATRPIRSRGDASRFREALRAGRTGARDAAIFALGANTAFRISDLLAFRVGDVRDASGRIRDSVSASERKTGKLRRAPLNASARAGLAGYLETRPGAAPDEPLFPTSRRGGGPVNRRTVWKRFRAVADGLGMDGVAPHSMRKTFGLFLYEASGKEIAFVQKALRHSSPGTTLAYIGITDAMIDEAVLKINV